MLKPRGQTLSLMGIWWKCPDNKRNLDSRHKLSCCQLLKFEDKMFLSCLTVRWLKLELSTWPGPTGDNWENTLWFVGSVLRSKCALTVSGQVVDERGEEGDEHTGDDDVDDVEQRFAFDDQVEGDVLVLVALHGNVLVGVSLGRPVDDLPLAVLCRGKQHRGQEADNED